jgi:hypothetical protein
LITIMLDPSTTRRRRSNSFGQTTTFAGITLLAEPRICADENEARGVTVASRPPRRPRSSVARGPALVPYQIALKLRQCPEQMAAL